ncbi:hypothetical protein IST419_04770 [Burkholderia multivorans]|nr:hypothetical protein IST419_04770 [Burkholderia multivorans]
MNACGFASNSARPARASTAGSRDCVAAIAMSLRDWPGWTVTVSGAGLPDATADAGASPVPAAHVEAAAPSASTASAPQTARDRRDRRGNKEIRDIVGSIAARVRGWDSRLEASVKSPQKCKSVALNATLSAGLRVVTA